MTVAKACECETCHESDRRCVVVGTPGHGTWICERCLETALVWLRGNNLREIRDTLKTMEAT
jgi:hypothetical protein